MLPTQGAYPILALCADPEEGNVFGSSPQPDDVCLGRFVVAGGEDDEVRVIDTKTQAVVTALHRAFGVRTSLS